MASFDRIHHARRSMNAELCEGSTDGKYKKLVRDRSGIVEQTTAQHRTDLSEYYHVQQIPQSGVEYPVPPFVKMRG